MTEAYGSILSSFIKITLEPEVAISCSLFVIEWDIFKMFSIWGGVIVTEKKKQQYFKQWFQKCTLFLLPFFSPFYSICIEAQIQAIQAKTYKPVTGWLSKYVLCSFQDPLQPSALL